MPLTDKNGIVTNKMRRNAVDNAKESPKSEAGSPFMNSDRRLTGGILLAHGTSRSRSGVLQLMEVSRNLGHPTMFKKAKGVTGFMAEMSEKAGPLNAMAYMILRGVGTRKKGGPQKMKGHPTMCMKTKGKKLFREPV